MSKILVSGLINMETTVKVKEFPISYFPIDYPFFGVNTEVSGVGYNVAKALKTLSDEVVVCSLIGDDFAADHIEKRVKELQLSTRYLKRKLQQTPNTAVLYDQQGKRQIYCDLKDIQDREYGFDQTCCEDCDIVIACNIHFNRELLKKAKAAGRIIASDVHVLTDIQDSYNRDFMEYADILFLSDEGIQTDYREFLLKIEECFHNEIIVLGMGKAGALMYVKKEQKFYEYPAVQVGKVVNTVGAGDALFAGFLHYYAKGMPPQEALLRGEIFAAIKIQSDGAANGFGNEKQVEEIFEYCSKNR